MSTSSLPIQGTRVYRAYRIGLGGGIVTAEVIRVDDDAQATVCAQALASLYPIELWERARFLGRFEPAALAQVSRSEALSAL